LDSKTVVERIQKRRENHNHVERRRRDCINDTIYKLSQVIPYANATTSSTVGQQKLNKHNVLKSALDHILVRTKHKAPKIKGFSSNLAYITPFSIYSLKMLQLRNSFHPFKGRWKVPPVISLVAHHIIVVVLVICLHYSRKNTITTIIYLNFEQEIGFMYLEICILSIESVFVNKKNIL
jgi:hypothetical protein